MKSNIKYTGNLNGEGGWLTGIELDPVAVDAAPGSEGWEPISAVIDADENGDIEVEYTKPETIRNVPVSVTINSEDSVEIIPSSPARGYYIAQNGIVAVLVNNAKIVYPYLDSSSETYLIHARILSDTDKYNVTLNGNAVAYSNGQYNIGIESNTYPTEFNIVISDVTSRD